jgi:hypothetical protein
MSDTETGKRKHAVKKRMFELSVVLIAPEQEGVQGSDLSRASIDPT